MYYYRNLVIFLLIGAYSFALAQNCAPGDSLVQIELHGLKHTHEWVVQRSLEQRVGGFFDSTVARREVNSWQDLDIFAGIELRCVPKEGGVVLRYEFLEMFQYLPSPALKQSDQDGWMLGGALAALNFAGRAMRLELQVRTAVDPWWQAMEYAFYGRAPWLGDWPLAWSGELVKTDSYDALRLFNEQSYYGNVAGTYPWTKGWWVTGQAGFRYLHHTEPQGWLRTGGYDYTPRLGAGLIYDTRDAKSNTTRGIFSEWSLTQAGGFLGGAGDFREYLWDLQGFYPTAWGWWRGSGLLRWRPGLLGFYEMLHQGGANTLRAYNPDPSISGQHELIANFEYRRELLRRRPINLWGIQGFYGLQFVLGADGTLLWTDALGSENVRSSIYGGVHLVVPALERLRIEYGYSPRHKVWNISVGLFEKSATQRWRSR